MQNNLLEKRDDPKEFFSELYRIWSDERQNEEKKLPSLLVGLNKDQNIDLCQMAVDAMNDSFRPFNVSPIFEDAMSDMNLNIASVLRLAEALFEGMQGDMIAHRQFKPFDDLILKQPDFSRAVLVELLGQDKPFVSGYISRFFQGFAENNTSQIHKEVCALKDHQSKYVLIAVADVLGELNYNSSENRKLIPKTLSVLADLERKNIDEVNRIIIFSYSNLLNFSEIAKDKIIEFSKSDQTILQGAVSYVLFRLQEEHGNEEWFSRAFLSLSSVSCQYKGIMDDIDFILAGLIEKNNNWNLAEEFFTNWLLCSDYSSRAESLSELFNSAFAVFVNKRANLEELITKFFNHDNFKIHNAAAEMISFCQLHRMSDLNLSKKVLKSLSYEDCLYICRKILGYVNSPQYLCSLCFSILDAFPRNKDLQSLIYSIFRSHIGENHPGRTLEFLKKILSETKSQNKKKVASQVIEDIELYLAKRDSLPRLKELSPSRQKTLKIYRESGKRMSAAMEEAQRNSIVSMIASRIILKQGTGSFHFMFGKCSDISKMGKFSETVEIPHAEVTHPVDAALERINFRLAKRGD